MISILSESPSAARLADTDILLQFTKQPCQKRLPGLSSNVSLRSRSLYLVFSLSLKRNNSLSTDKELFPIGQAEVSSQSKISALKQYNSTQKREIFSPLKYLVPPRSKTLASKSKTFTLERQTFTSRSKALTTLKYLIFNERCTLSLYSVSVYTTNNNYQP